MQVENARDQVTGDSEEGGKPELHYDLPKGEFFGQVVGLWGFLGGVESVPLPQ